MPVFDPERDLQPSEVRLVEIYPKHYKIIELATGKEVGEAAEGEKGREALEHLLKKNFNYIVRRDLSF